VNLTWHLCYQGLTFQAGASKEVQAEYAELLAAEPENGALAFRAGRATADPDEAARLFDRAAEADPDLPWPWLQKAMQAATTGDMAAAREFAATARRLAPDREEVGEVLFGIRCALGEYGGLEDKLRQETAKGLEAGFRNWDRLMQVLGITGQKEEVEAVQKAFLQAIGNAPELREFRLRAASRAALCYWLDDADGCRSAAKEAADATIFYPACSWGLLRWGDPDSTAAYVARAPLADLPARLLMLSLACRRQGEADMAADALERALDSLDRSSFSGQALAGLLRSEDDVDRAALDAVSGRLISKAAALVLLAERQPAQAPEFLDLAETLSRTDPHAQRFLSPFIAAAREQAATAGAAAAGG
jgi:hypothetical protein